MIPTDAATSSARSRRKALLLTLTLALSITATTAIFGGLFGARARRESLRSLGEVGWSEDAVVIDIASGSWGGAAGFVIAGIVAVGSLPFFAVLPGLRGRRARRTKNEVLAVALLLVGIAGIAVGWSSATAQDRISTSTVGAHLLQQGDMVDVELRSEPSGSGGNGTSGLPLPIFITFDVGTLGCSISFGEQSVEPEGGAVRITPTCNDSELTIPGLPDFDPSG